MTTDYKNKMAARDNALDASGIGHDVGDKFRAGNELIAKIAGEFIKHASGQLAHNLLVNVPCGVDMGEKDAGVMAVRAGLVATISAMIEWNICDARLVAGELLEDCNDHEEAEKLFKLAR